MTLTWDPMRRNWSCPTQTSTPPICGKSLVSKGRSTDSDRLWRITKTRLGFRGTILTPYQQHNDKKEYWYLKKSKAKILKCLFFHFQYGVSEEDDIRMKWVWIIISFLHIHAFSVHNIPILVCFKSRAKIEPTFLCL